MNLIYLSAAQLSGTGVSKWLDAVVDNIDTLNRTGLYFIYHITSANKLGTYPYNMASAAHLIHLSEGWNAVNSRFQILVPFDRYNRNVWYRIASDNENNGVDYSPWKEFSNNPISISSTDTTDLNDLTEHAKYFLYISTQPNKPFTNWAYLFNIVKDSARKLQLIVGDNNNNIKMRTKVGSDWANWITIYPNYTDCLMATNGYMILTTGLLIQWGRVLVNQNTFLANESNTMAYKIINTNLDYNTRQTIYLNFLTSNNNLIKPESTYDGKGMPISNICPMENNEIELQTNVIMGLGETTGRWIIISSSINFNN